MKKLLLSSVCAVALLGVNAFANSLDTFLSQKADLENQINIKNQEMTSKNDIFQDLLNQANEKRVIFDTANKNIQNVLLGVTSVEGSYNNSVRNQNNLEAMLNALNDNKLSLNNDIDIINTNIKNYEANINKLENDLTLARADVTAKNEAYKNALGALEQAKINSQYNEKQKAHEDALKKHDDLMSKYADESLTLEQKKALEAQLVSAKNEIDAANNAINAAAKSFESFTIAKEKAANDLKLAKEECDKIFNEQNKVKKDKDLAQNSLDLKNQDLMSLESKITEKNQLLENAKTIANEALAKYESAKAELELAKQKAENAKIDLEKADIDANTAKLELENALNELQALEQSKKDLENEILTKTQEGQKATQEIENAIGNVNSEYSKDLAVLLASSNGVLNEQDRKKASELVDKIATQIADDKKDEVAQGALSSLNIQINNMNKRLGEIRGLNSDLGSWFRFYGGKMSNNNDSFHYYSMQIGVDNMINQYDKDLILGLVGGYDRVNASISSKSYSIGVYGSYLYNNGVFADAVAKYIHTHYKKSGYSIKNQKSFLASFELGYRYDVRGQYYFEPSIEFITGRIGGYKSVYKGTTTTVDSYYPAIFKPQAFFGMNYEEFIFRIGGGAVLNTKQQNAKIAFNIQDFSANKNVKLSKNDYGFISLGTSYTFNNNLRLNVSLERSFDGVLTNDYEFNSTIRYTF